MSNAVLDRQSFLDRQSEPHRMAHVRGGGRPRTAAAYGRSRTELRRRAGDGDLRRPASGSVSYGSGRVGVSCAAHVRPEAEVGWRMVLATVAITAGVLCGLFGVALVATTDAVATTGTTGGAVVTEVVHVQTGG
ncbi:hypothetical protein BFN03_06310 [Rhodococcus sp. WMMA185]|uniref:hypothetical protein n=1 Tax=Rhodococcus sp. WMMA185 TaxID=679318 RepID=UPI00087912BF|nr:hypothetical protein [Rhodococcus sp. WMMA185]AOW92451.1 hypothetical protein BFN03_06310 [Rhodococcus sp. WMMA185]